MMNLDESRDKTNENYTWKYEVIEAVLGGRSQAVNIDKEVTALAAQGSRIVARCSSRFISFDWVIYKKEEDRRNEREGWNKMREECYW